MKRLLPLLLALLCLLSGGCAAQSMSRTSFALNTTVSVTLYDCRDEAIADGAIDLCASYEAIFSRTDPASELCRLNAGELTEVSPELASVMEEALFFAQLSGGAFDPTMGGLADLWNFSGEAPAVPDPGQVALALKGVGYAGVEIRGGQVILPEGCRIDLGAIAKGYIADQMREYLTSQGVTSAIIDLGGNLCCLGTKPGGEPFRVGIQYPYRNRNEVIAAMDAADLSVVTSGVYERYFEEDGVLYHHILDSATGFPVKNSLLAVTVAAPSSLTADALSTACFALGLEKGMALIDSLEGIYALFITDDFALHPSAGMEEACRLEVLS